MHYVFSTEAPKRYRFPTHVNDLVMDRADAATSEVFLVELAPGEAPPLHIHHDMEQIFYVLRGRGRLEIGEGDETFEVKPTDVVRIPPSTWHRIHCLGDETLQYVAVDCFLNGRNADEPTWDSHVRVVCDEQGWDYEAITRRDTPEETMNNPLTGDQLEQFNRDGYLIVRGLFDREEMQLLIAKAKADAGLQEQAYGREDSKGNTIRLALWNHPGDDLYGIFSRSRRIVDRMEALLGDEVYHYHSKMILKEPFVGGAWEWHQDYGYWYNDGCLLPDMASCSIALDPATRENGCMQVLKGSHLMGRIEHGVVAGQTGADMERVNAARERFELVYCEMEPGDALFFHGNLLHASAPNESANPRWSLICCYNTRRNDPYKQGRHPNYTPLSKVEDSAIKEAGRAEAGIVS